ncbi:MAG: GntR family transcriptional regulator [Victivallales bacterium]|nr:GntR family transcriptional regulator [Victivallales bacterium]
MNEKLPLYEKLICDIKTKIERGVYRTGEKVDSLNQLCQRYGVSKITAIRAIDELQTLGLLRKVAGRGTFVTGMRYEEQELTGYPELKSIILFSKGFIEHSADSNFAKQIYNSIVSTAYELNVDVRVEHISESELYGSTRIPFTPKPEEGVIALARDTVIPMLYLFTDPNCRRVLVDTSVAGVPNVLTDNYDGVRQMLEYLQSLGHEHILFAARFADGQNFVNENERLEAFINLSAHFNIRGRFVTSGNFEDIFKILRQDDRPTAIFFSRDDPAIKLATDLRERGIDVPGDVSIAGYDDYATRGYELSTHTTVKVDTAQLGRSAVNQLRKAVDTLSRVPLTRRVKSHLIIRKSCAPPSGTDALDI